MDAILPFESSAVDWSELFNFPMEEEKDPSTDPWWTGIFLNDPFSKKRKIEDLEPKTKSLIKIQSLWSQILPLVEELPTEHLISKRMFPSAELLFPALQRVNAYLRKKPLNSEATVKAASLNALHVEWNLLKNQAKNITSAALQEPPIHDSASIIRDMGKIFDAATRMHYEKIATEVRVFVRINYYKDNLINGTYYSKLINEEFKIDYKEGLYQLLKEERFKTVISDSIGRRATDDLGKPKIIKDIFEYIFKYYSVPFSVYSIRGNNTPFFIIGADSSVSGINNEYEQHFGEQSYIASLHMAPLPMARINDIFFKKTNFYLDRVKIKFNPEKDCIDFLYGSRVLTRSEFYSLLDKPEEEIEVYQKILPLLPSIDEDARHCSKELMRQILNELRAVKVKILENEDIINRFKRQLTYILKYRKE